ncbi:uncharacterized protein LOC110417385 [Herrania umbratica]|uniref:Uncharacterized protein LOC110417385 n=1 Tax=Herrania umbratica TaxID=108875 RepID=A0A6J1AFG7_9ROSI|nr:uncharacterized protein LOC110417385 [Herrania umbratica]XP_021285389.1 uncharacterized protein LOC110417385 [Herrania umbratica]XP_021285390.1 uncharacterized protein LOC110417385 [Herrania umbratica]
MATPAASPPANIDFNCTDEEFFIWFSKLTSGSPLPSNVIDENPYKYPPQYIPKNIWFLISSNDSIDVEHGFWTTKQEARVVFSNSDIIGWKTIHEYYEGHVPYECKTEYVMQVFSITQKILSDDNEKKEKSSMCRVSLFHEMQQTVSSAGVEAERNRLAQPPVLDANSSTRIASLSNPEVNKHDAVAGRLPVPEHHGENINEMDSFPGGQIDEFLRENFLELDDLDSPASPSSSSDNSSALSLSSGECFDAVALLQDIEDQVIEQKEEGKKLNVTASNKLDEVVIVPATLGSVVSVEESNSGSDESFKTTGSVPISASKHAKGDQRGEGPSSSSDNRMAASAGGRKRAAFGGMKKLRKKYLCFMPF